MLDFQLSTVIFTVLNLLILYVVLRKLLFGRVNRILEERAALVEKELSSAERQKAQAEEMRKEYEDQLAQAHAQAAKIVDQAKARGEQEYQAILDQAQEDTRRMQEQAQAKNRADREKLMRSAKRFSLKWCRRAVVRCGEVDLAMKSTGQDGQQLLTGLLLELAAPASRPAPQRR